jgi:hypothetical protein
MGIVIYVDLENLVCFVRGIACVNLLMEVVNICASFLSGAFLCTYGVRYP